MSFPTSSRLIRSPLSRLSLLNARRPLTKRPMSSSTSGKAPSGHMLFYRDIVPAMLPIFLLGSGVYMSLHLTRTYLSHEKYALEAKERIAALEEEVQELRASQLIGTLPTAASTSTASSTSSESSKRWWGLGIL